MGINKSLKVFQDIEDFSNIIFNMKFESIIVSFTSSEDGKYILICLENGLVNIFDIEKSSSPLFSE